MRWTWRNFVLAVVRTIRRLLRRPARLRAFFACEACEAAKATEYVWSEKAQRKVPLCDRCNTVFEYVNGNRDTARRWRRGRQRRTR